MSDTAMEKAVKRWGRHAKVAVERLDSWTNAITGLGTSRDKLMATQFADAARLPNEVLEGMYHGDDIVSRVCDVVPEEMLRQGFNVKIEASDDDADENPPPGDVDPKEPRESGIGIEEAVQVGTDVEAAMEDMGATKKFVEALVWERLFGGSVIFMGADDGALPEEMMNPLNEANIRGIDFLNVLDRRNVIPLTWYRNPTESKFGLPETYLLTRDIAPTTNPSAALDDRTAIQVHETRLIVFGGGRVTVRRRQGNEGWGDSIIQRMHDVIVQFQANWQAVAHMVQDSAQAKFKIQGLIDMISGDESETLQKRMQIVDYNRSVARAILLDAEMEDFTRDPINLGGVDAVLDKFMLRLAAAARMPVTILMGQSPAGMNATGTSDRQIWFDQIAAQQEHNLKPHLERLARLVMLSREGPTGGSLPENWNVEFPSLFQMTPKEDAELRKLVADTDGAYIDRGVVNADEVALSRVPVTGWSAETTIDLEARKALMESGPEEEPGMVDPNAEPVPVPEDEPEEIEDDEEAVDPQTALNGAQVKALQDIVLAVANEELPRTTGVNMIAAAFPLSNEEAEAVMGEVGNGFKAKAKAVPPAFGATPPIPPKPGVEPEPPEDELDEDD